MCGLFFIPWRTLKSTMGSHKKICFSTPLSISAVADIQDGNLLGRASQTLFLLMTHQVVIVSSAALSLPSNTRHKGQP